MSETRTSLAETLAQIGAVLEDYPDAHGLRLMVHLNTDEEMSEAASALGFTGTPEFLKHSGGMFYVATFDVAGVDVSCFGPLVTARSWRPVTP